MRAVWLPILDKQDEHRIQGEAHHHLVHVVRIEIGEEVLLLDGKGLSIRTKVKAVTKKEVILAHIEELIVERPYEIDLALGIPKRDALELCLKAATELGLRKIYLVRSAFSQIKVPEWERLKKLLISSLEQSNAAYLPTILESSWAEVPWDEYSQTLFLDSQKSEGASSGSRVPLVPGLLVVGPEGGFSDEELQFLRSRPNLEALRLPTPILRTNTALAAGTGILLQRLMDR